MAEPQGPTGDIDSGIGDGLEVWRGGVNTWECDANGHMNIRFYLAHALEGLPALAAAMGMPRAFSAAAASTLIAREHHIRFVREARANDALHIMGGVLEMDETEAVLFQLVLHSGSGEVAAAVTTRVAHVTPQKAGAFPWPERMRERAKRLTITVPPKAAPRSLTPGPAPLTGSLDRARTLGLRRLAVGSVAPADCDVFGRHRPDAVMGRISDGFPQFAVASRATRFALAQAIAEPGESDEAARERIGGAAVEMRIVYGDAPRAGDRVELWSGLRSVDTRTMGIVHWLLDPETGQPWAAAEHIVVNLDLKARRIIEVSAAMAKGLQAATIPSLTL